MRLACMAVAACFPSHALADTGGELLRKCERLVVGMSALRDRPAALEAGQCMGYLDGFTSGWIWSTGDKPSPAFPFCEPQGVTQNQEIAILVKYLRGNPERLHLDGGSLLVEALTAAFPCTPKP